ncbi:MAG: family 78 glycoside hydrolase catalytic domain [Pseudomonadales bacterium]
MLGAPQRLRCEYLENPLGVDEIRPRLSWWVNDPRPAEIQTAYQIIAASCLELLALDEGDFWDSGRVQSQQTYNVEYLGKPLISERRVYWKIRTYDSDGMPSPWSEGAFFEMGLLTSEDWRAQWIGAPLIGSRASGVPVPLLRREFELTGTTVSARLHISALGLYRAEINGNRIGDGELTPSWTDYDKRVEYQTYDVTKYLRAGDNVLGVLLADGWYAGRTGRGERQQYGRRPLLCAQLSLTLASGTTVVIATDALWRWRPSWIIAADLVSGESVDGRQFAASWSTPECAAQDWSEVTLTEVAAERVATTAPLIKSTAAVTATLISASPQLIYELPCQLLGRIRLALHVSEGALIRVRYADRLTAEGALIAHGGEDSYTAQGLAEGEVFEPAFSLHGFRYVEVSGDIFHEDAVTVSAVALRQAIPVAGEFVCDHAALNSLQIRLNERLRNACFGIPFAGCATGLRTGDTGGAFVNLATTLLNFESAAFYGKWLRDLADAQLADGGFPEVVPAPPGFDDLSRDAGAPRSDVLVQTAWRLYRHCGDRRVLERYFPAIKRFFTGLMGRYPNYIRSNDPQQQPAGVANDLLATAWYYNSARLAARIAGVLGNLTELEEFEGLAASIRSAFRRRFVTPDGRVVSDSPEAYALVCAFGMLEATEYRTAVPELLQHVESGGYLKPTVEILDTLTQLGRLDLAYQVLLRETEHSRETAVGETAPGDQIVGRGIGEWLFTAAAGMDLDRDLSERHNAYRRMRIRPRPPLGIGFPEGPPLRAVEASLETVNGRYEVAWQIDDDGFELSVRVPCNCEAKIIMPDDSVHDVVAGEHEFVMPFSEAGDGIPVLREVSQAT